MYFGILIFVNLKESIFNFMVIMDTNVKVLIFKTDPTYTTYTKPTVDAQVIQKWTSADEISYLKQIKLL